MQTLLAFLFVLGVLIFVHELGHFLLARWHGVRVLTFSLGFGPKLLSVRRGDTEYCLSAVPLGGYVKMAGETLEDSPNGAADEFLSKTKWQRFQVLIAGPAMNLILAVAALAIVLMQGAEVPAFQNDPVVLGAVEAGSPAERGGLQAGDRVTAVAGRETPTWEDFFVQVGTRADQDVPLVVQRGTETLRLTVRPEPDLRFRTGEVGALPDVYPSVRSVTAGSPAEQAGLRAGDVLVAIEGRRMVLARQVSELIGPRGGQPTRLTIRRDGATQDLTITPAVEGTTGRIGIAIANATREFTPGVLEAVGLSVQRNVEMAGMILQTVWGLVAGQTSPKQLMGPVGIAQLSGESAAAGWIALLSLMASLSLNLGLLNLLPIPVLDGGHITIIAMETVARRNFSVAVKEKMLFAGFVVLMLLMVTVIYNDLTRIAWLERLMPWRH